MKMLRSPVIRMTAIMGLGLVAAACARQPEMVVTPGDPPGFFLGLVQGFGIVFAFIGTFFTEDIAIYAVPNSGWTYDIGFILGAGFFFAMGGAGGASGGKGKA